MVKNPNVPIWSKTAERHIETYLDVKTKEVDDDFKEHVKYLRTDLDGLDGNLYPPDMYPSPLTRFMQYFNFPTEMKGLMRHYIKTDEVDFSLMRPPIAAIDERDNTYRLNIDEVDEEWYSEIYQDQKSFKLIIPNGTRTSEIIEFIRKEKDYIDKQLNNVSAPLKKSKESPAWLAIKIVNLRRKGYSNDKIAELARFEEWPCHALNGDNVAVIYARSKNKLK